MAAIIVPAHNEATVIARCLDALVSQAAPEDEVIVCANGCRDDTAEIVARYQPRVTLLCLSAASKVRAINIADDLAQTYPRIYVDADIVFQAGALDRLKQTLESGQWLAAAPEPEMELAGSSWPVRAYYRIWLSLPYCRQGMIGAGVYGLSAEGRARFDRFPDLIADDGYVRALFQEAERCMVKGARVSVRAPETLRSLLKIKIRSRTGQLQLAAAFPNLRANERKSYAVGIGQVLRNPVRWPAVLVYLWVSMVTRIAGHRQLSRAATLVWEKDWSSRRPDPEKSPP